VANDNATDYSLTTGLSSTSTATSQSANTVSGNRTSIYYPAAEVSIYTETSNIVVKGEIKPDVTKFGYDIVSITTSRMMHNDAPVFSLNLVYRDEWFYSIASNDLVVIKMCRPPEKLKVTFVGLVDDCRRNFVYNQNKPVRVLTISGRGLNKAFLSFNIGIVNEVEVSENFLGYLGQEVSLEGCAANEAIDKLINAYAGAYIDYNFSDNSSLLKKIQLKLSARPDYTLLDVSSLLNYQGSLWQLMKEIQNAPFNELFWEVIDDIPTLCLRPTPFSKELWEQLSTTDILDEEIITDGLGRSDLETYTLYSVNCSTMLSSMNATNSFGYVPLWYPPYFKKYGVRRLDVTTMYSMFAGANDKDTANTRSMQCTQDLFNWNIKNNSMYNGTLLVRGSNRYKLGSRVNLKSEGMELYVEGVTSIFNVFGTYQIQLALTRGLPPQDRFNEPYDQYETFDPSIFGIKTKTVASASDSSGDIGTATGTGAEVVAYAKTFLGVPYEYGATGPNSFDCSGYVQYVYKHFGVNLPRTSQEQSNCGKDIDINDQSKWQAGDLLFSEPGSNGPGHVMMYLGNGKMIEAPHRNDKVKIAPVPSLCAVRRVL
jgi:cell wall-associated NlpC family hydrolase